MNCIVVEDEPAAQLILNRYIGLCPGLTCQGIFSDALSAQAFLDTRSTDLIFLDINLPEISGVSFLRSLVNPPLVVFTTAYMQYAIEGFDLEIVDFLLKPFSFERFCKAVNKAKNRFNTNPVTPAGSSRISVRSDKSIYQLEVNEILFIDAMGDYLNFHCEGKKLVVHGTLKSWEEKLSGYSFLKIHRSTLVNLNKIDHLEGNQVIVGKHKLQISEPFRGPLLNWISGD